MFLSTLFLLLLFFETHNAEMAYKNRFFLILKFEKFLYFMYHFNIFYILNITSSEWSTICMQDFISLQFKRRANTFLKLSKIDLTKKG